MLVYAVCVLAGVGVGIIIMTLFRHKKSVGVVYIVQQDPAEDPYLFLELSKEVSEVSEMDYITVQVNAKKYISHK